MHLVWAIFFTHAAPKIHHETEIKLCQLFAQEKAYSTYNTIGFIPWAEATPVSSEPVADNWLTGVVARVAASSVDMQNLWRFKCDHCLSKGYELLHETKSPLFAKIIYSIECTYTVIQKKTRHSTCR